MDSAENTLDRQRPATAALVSYPAVTVRQPYASLIIAGVKPFEFRSRRAPKAFVGTRIAIHAAARVPTRVEIDDLLFDLEKGLLRSILGRDASLSDAEKIERILRRARGDLPRSAVLCTAIMGPSEPFGAKRWGWPLSQVWRLAEPAPASGNQGWWKWRTQA